MVSISPRLRDDLEYEDPEELDPRFSMGFRSVSLESYEEHESLDDRRAFAHSPDSGASRRRRRKRHSDQDLLHYPLYQYQAITDSRAFRLVVLYPGAKSSPVQCQMIPESSETPQKEYLCLSYCWQTTVRNATILCNGLQRFPVTKNLLSALMHLRSPTRTLLIWIDQICINQDDLRERAHQVSIMKHIFSKAKEVIVWLGEADDRSERLCEYASRLRRGDGNAVALNRILTSRQLQDALQKLLARPWFSRVWVIPEIALANFTSVAIGRSIISWDNLVRLIRDVQVPQTVGFDKHHDVLGNPRQRIAIITQMIQSQRQGLHHTDIMQLLILAKGSKATDLRDMVYAFYGITLLSTYPDYSYPIERLYADVAHLYVTNILDYDSYASHHGLSEERKTQQLMSILYSAGKLQQHCTLSTWIPDWTHGWHIAPLWCKTTSNIVTGSAIDVWSAGVRSEHRAGGNMLGTFEIIDDKQGGMRRLRISVLIFDHIVTVNEFTPASTPKLDAPSPETPGSASDISPTLRYGRTFFTTAKGFNGIATPGVEMGDELAILVGGDVPVAIRRCKSEDRGDGKAYQLLCEVLVQSKEVMDGHMVAGTWADRENIIFV